LSVCSSFPLRKVWIPSRLLAAYGILLRRR
jgi:hypothetical protein